MQRKLCFFLTSACLLSTGRIRRGRVSPDRLSERCCLSQALARRCECSLSIPGLESKAHHPRVALAIWEQRGHSQSPSLLALRLSQTPALCCYPADGVLPLGPCSPAPRQGEPQHAASSSSFGCGLQIAGCWGAAFKGIWRSLFSPDCAIQRVLWMDPEPPGQLVHKVGAGAGWLGASPLARCAVRPQGLGKKARGKKTSPSYCSCKAQAGMEP